MDKLNSDLIFKREKLDENFSRVFQHEHDHLEGNVFFKDRKVVQHKCLPALINNKELNEFKKIKKVKLIID